MIEPAILHYCKYQERCQQEVRSKLYELGFKAASYVEEQIAMLIESGALNEERFARAYARGKFRMKQWGREKIKRELKMRKISDFCIKKGLSEINEEDYDNTLNKIASKKAEESRADRSILSRKQKLYRYLVQKGYERDLVTDMVNKYLDPKEN